MSHILKGGMGSREAPSTAVQTTVLYKNSRRKNGLARLSTHSAGLRHRLSGQRTPGHLGGPRYCALKALVPRWVQKFKALGRSLPRCIRATRELDAF